MAQMKVLLGKKVQDVLRLDTPGVLVGRSADADLVLHSEVVSRHHCQIVEYGAGHAVLDLNSRSGILVNGKRVERHVLMHGDRLQVAKYTLVYEITPSDLSQDPEGTLDGDDPSDPREGEESAGEAGGEGRGRTFGALTEAPPPRPVSSLRGIEPPDVSEEFRRTMMASTSEIMRVHQSLLAEAEPHLKVRLGDEFKRLPLGDRPFTIGYFDGATYRLDGDRWLGKLQCSISRKGGGYRLRVLSLWARVRVDGHRVRGEVPLADGAVVVVGGTRFRFSAGGGA